MADLRRLSDVPIDLTVEIGRTRLTVGETLELRQGSILTLNRMAGEPVDLLVNGTPIAHGEVVVIDEQFGVRVTDVLGSAAPAARGRSRLSSRFAAVRCRPCGAGLTQALARVLLSPRPVSACNRTAVICVMAPQPSSKASARQAEDVVRVRHATRYRDETPHQEKETCRRKPTRASSWCSRSVPSSTRCRSSRCTRSSATTSRARSLRRSHGFAASSACAAASSPSMTSPPASGSTRS